MQFDLHIVILFAILAAHRRPQSFHRTDDGLKIEFIGIKELARRLEEI